MFRLEMVNSSIIVYNIWVNKFNLHRPDDMYILPYTHLWSQFNTVLINKNSKYKAITIVFEITEIVNGKQI